MFFNLCWKNCEKPFVGEHGHFEGKGMTSDKNQHKLFCKKWGFEYFSYNNLKKKTTTIFSKITAKNNFWGHDHFLGNEVSDDKNEYNLLYGKWGTKYSFEIFSSKPPYRLNESQKTSFGSTLFSISVVSIGPIVSQKIGLNHYVDWHQPWEFPENQFKTATYIVTVIIIINWKSKSVIF